MVWIPQWKDRDWQNRPRNKIQQNAIYKKHIESKNKFETKNQRLANNILCNEHKKSAGLTILFRQNRQSVKTYQEAKNITTHCLRDSTGSDNKKAYRSTYSCCNTLHKTNITGLNTKVNKIIGEDLNNSLP